jgi:hypothetical protein
MKQVSTRTRALVSAVAASALTALAATSGGAAGPVHMQVAPRNESPPTISGARRVGATLTANPGRWSGTAPIAFRYQWVRCNAQLANCSRVVSRSRRYTLGSTDRGRRMVVVVTAVNRDGSANAQADTGVIAERATRPSNTIAPSLSGEPREGQALTANPGTWSGTPPITFAYQWLRCDANGGACASIAGAAARTYVLSSSDVGRSIRARVTARNDGGNRSLDTPPTAVVQPGGPGGQIRLPDGRVSVPIESVSLPARLVVDEVRFSPNPVRSRSRPITIRVHVSDTRGFVVRGALVFLRSTPLVTTVPPEQGTATDGWVTLTVRPRAPRPGLVFPLRRGLAVQFYVQARKAGERLLYGVAGSRLVQVYTAAP